MKMTIELPDDLVTDIKIEAARERRKLKDLVPELLRDGLRRNRASPGSEAAGSQSWIDAWVALGAQATAGQTGGPTTTQILASDRDRL